jgi:hypothetical protein
MNVLQRYFKHRQSIIDQYVKGDMTKREYLAASLDAVMGLNIAPFKNIDTVEKGLFNYQYYNAMAKQAKGRSYRMDDYELKREQLDETDYYYQKKDSATSRVLTLLDYNDVHAYYIKVNSKALDGKLFEIVIEPYEMILHSANEGIRNKLAEAGVFNDTVKKSLIDGYINQKY